MDTFERLDAPSWLLTRPRYNELEKVWLWEDFPSARRLGGADTGIKPWPRPKWATVAIQVQMLSEEDAVIDKPPWIRSLPPPAARSLTKSLSRPPGLPNEYGFPPPTIGEATPRKPSATKTRLSHG